MHQNKLATPNNIFNMLHGIPNNTMGNTIIVFMPAVALSINLQHGN